MVNELEAALWDAAGPIRSTRFSQILQQARNSTRSASLPGPTDNFRHGELSFDPAVHRTIGGYMGLQAIRQANSDDQEWLTWTHAAKRAMCRVAAKCWSGIDQELRHSLVDTDNFLPIWGQCVFAGLRDDSPGRHLAFEGLGAPAVAAALDRIVKAARATPTYTAAASAADRLQKSRKLTGAWGLLAKQGLEGLQAASRLTIGDGADRGREIVETLYAGTAVETEGAAMRRMNRLVQQIVWSVLGFAELVPGPVLIEEVDGTIRSTVDFDGSPFIRLTSHQDTHALLRLTNPVMLRTGTPLDGLYVVVGQTMHLGNAASCDLSLVPLRWSASQWP